MSLREFKAPATLDEAIQLAAEFLPVGYTISVNIEHHGCSLMLEAPTETLTSDDDNEFGLVHEFIDLLNMAIVHHAKACS